jgi:predicted alpha/beta hydrolase family esterase
MRNALLLHGTGGSDNDYFWFADTKQYLEANGYKVWWQLMPHTEKPELSETRSFVEQNMPALDTETILIGHSSACSLILDLLQHTQAHVKQIVLVGGFYAPLDDDGYSNLMLPEHFDWDSISSQVGDIILINSDNDPWGCNDQQAREPAIKLGAKLVVASGQGHMGSISFKQPYTEFPLLKRLLLVNEIGGK